MMPSLDWYPPKFDLVRNHTKPKVNHAIDRDTQTILTKIGTEPHLIRQRLWELDREWHIDRALMAVLAALGAVAARSSFVAMREGRRWSGWRVMFWTQVGFLLHHAIRGWSPPASVLRRIGFRTEKEIAAERATLEKRLACTSAL